MVVCNFFLTLQRISGLAVELISGEVLCHPPVLPRTYVPHFSQGVLSGDEESTCLGSLDVIARMGKYIPMPLKVVTELNRIADELEQRLKQTYRDGRM